jgi:hypothetical protein
MGQEWQEAWGRLLVLYRQSEEAEERYHAMAPEFPAALTKTERDWQFALCVHPGTASDATFQREFIEQFRIKPRMRPVQHGLEPWPEAQARADEIVAAWDKYLADMRTVRERSGFEKADEAAREAVAELPNQLWFSTPRLPLLSPSFS